MGGTGRTNEMWVSELRGTGVEQQVALADLRRMLVHGLRRALSSSSRVDESLLEDAVQETLVRILNRLDQFEGRSQFVTWATAIGIRTALSELRRSRWKDVSLDELLAAGKFTGDDTLDQLQQPDVQWERTAILAKMQASIDSALTEKQRVALIAELKGMPQEEIARQLGSTRNAVYKLTHDARKRLKRAMEDAGYKAADVRTAFMT